MKKIITKTDIRTEINQQIADYLEQGGAVQEIDRGISGRADSTSAINPNKTTFTQPRTERTYVPEVIAAIEKRRSEQYGPSKPPKSNSSPKKKLIYDDFGEPLRWEWVD